MTKHSSAIEEDQYDSLVNKQTNHVFDVNETKTEPHTRNENKKLRGRKKWFDIEKKTYAYWIQRAANVCRFRYYTFIFNVT